MKFLVAASVGDRSRHRDWLGGRQAPKFDLWLAHYGEPSEAYRDEAQLYLARAAGKWENLHTLFTQHGEALSEYRAVFCPDDDLEMSAETINALFEQFVEHRLSLAQPAYTCDSVVSWKVTRQRPYLHLRYTNFVENGAAVFSAEALARCLESFPRSVTGFGLDLLWPYLLGYPERGIAVFDSLACRHRGDRSDLDERVLPREKHQAEGDRLLEGIPWQAVTERGFLFNENGLQMVNSGRSAEKVRALAEQTMGWMMSGPSGPFGASIGSLGGL